MAKAKVVHSDDAVHVFFKGDRRNPEPSTGVIEFPGGHVEVSRCTDGTYWAHIAVIDGVNIVDGRIDRSDRTQSASDLEDHQKINHIAIRVSNKVARFDPS